MRHPQSVTCVCLTTAPRRAGYLRDALRAYRAQDHAGPRELLVVNDGAPLASHAPDVRVVNLPPRARGRRWTIGAKRNAAVRAARGAWLATWDDDDVSLPERLADQLAAARATGAAVCLAGGFYVADASLRLLGECTDWRSGYSASSALLARDAVVAAGGYPDLDYLEDWALVQRIRLLARGSVVILPDAAWYVRRQHGAQASAAGGARDGTDAYVACAVRGGLPGRRRDVAADLARVLAGPGGNDVGPAVGPEARA